MRFEELPAVTQNAIRSGGARPAKARQAGHTRPGGATEVSARWECKPCGLIFEAWARVERHIDEEHGGGRIAFILDPQAGGS